ncbi:hypothetical protein OB919_20210 [Halobacteria archaeon AArc-curdl1]|uniref:Uncharacterized protein n=1 Tax=Natronosalvus hydrolyticus TaxID=2979988 RepID=A0AAP2ZD33_9EURY|nr:hypothetical protein [Halobacteria archaeon AArc-curdl1]
MVDEEVTKATDRERLEAHDGYARATALFNDQFGEEDRDTWRSAAPDEPHHSVSEDKE